MGGKKASRQLKSEARLKLDTGFIQILLKTFQTDCLSGFSTYQKQELDERLDLDVLHRAFVNVLECVPLCGRLH